MSASTTHTKAKINLNPQAMHPLRVILVRGSHTDLQAFSENIRSMTRAKVFTPSLGQVVNASMESHIYQVGVLSHAVLGK